MAWQYSHFPTPADVRGSAGVDTPREEVRIDDVPVILNGDERDAISIIVERLFSLTPDSAEFVELSDQFHQRVPFTQAKLVEDEATNASLAMELLDDLRKILNDLFPDDPNGSWDLAKRLAAFKPIINDIIERLDNGKPALRRDLSSIDGRIESYREGMTKLRKSIIVVKSFVQQIEAKLFRTSVKMQKCVRENVLFYLAQREMDLLTELAVTSQGYLALTTIRKSHVVLTQNIDRILTITVQALNNAMIVATNVQAASLDYMFDMRKMLLGFEGQQVKEMCQRFFALDQDLEQILPKLEKKKKGNGNINNFNSIYIETYGLNDLLT